VYVPKAFAEDRDEVVVELARRCGFGHLVVSGDDGPHSTPLPFVVQPEGTSVHAHLARANPVWRSGPCRALLIVPITDAYISPSWYPSKADGGEVVPTWNYEVVHARGRLEVRDDPVWVERQVRELTDRHEGGRALPWAVDDAPAEFIHRMLRGIVGVELVVDEWVGKRKLGQNRGDADRVGVVAGLESGDDRRPTVATSMRDVAERPV
jgi:transcriptional regulator